MHCGLAELLLTAVLLTAPVIAANKSSSNVWAAVGLSECNATCLPDGVATKGSQRVIFACYARSSTSIKRLPGSGAYLGVTAAGRLPGSDCADAPPADETLFVRCIRRILSGSCLSQPAHSWQLDASSMSACQLQPAAAAGEDSCGQQGFVRLGLRCRRSLLAVDGYGDIDVDDSQCQDEGLPRPDPLAVPCRALRQGGGCRPVWKAAAWGACSRDCGLGEKARTVECSQLADTPAGPAYVPAPGKCPDGDVRPHSREYCVVRAECPPYYRLRPGKCLPTFSSASASVRRWCNETGLRPTSVECVQLVGDATAGLNQTRRRPHADCFGLPRPPPFQRCRVDTETLAQRRMKCVEPDAAELTAPPRLLPAPAGSLLVQSERLPEIEALCGQSATLIPGTRLRLHCDVANFKSVDLRWRKLGRKREFAVRTSDTPVKPRRAARKKGGGPCGRICVSNGDLVFDRFKPRDAGTYEVTAGKAKAIVRLTWHTAYEAYLSAYLPRAHLPRRSSSGSSSFSSSLLTSSMSSSVSSFAHGGSAESSLLLMRDAPGMGGDTLAWMTGAWGDCPPCSAGTIGVRQRMRSVRCERLRSGAFAVVENGTCARLLGPPPASVEACDDVASRRCPSWHIGDWDDTCSISRCYLMGTSLALRSVTCHDKVKNLTLPDSECLLASGQSKPETGRVCSNSECQPEWSVGAWSACSVSCGGFGFRSRRVQCLWRSTGLPAGLACEALPLPRGFKSCYEGPCYQLGCVDLSPACKIYQASALCAHPSLRRSCCATCNTYQLAVYRSLRKTR